MTSKKAYYKFTRDEIEKALRLNTQAEITRNMCPCGCGAGVQYARDQRALWVASELQVDNEIRVIGIETADELARYLVRIPEAEHAVLRKLWAKGLG